MDEGGGGGGIFSSKSEVKIENNNVKLCDAPHNVTMPLQQNWPKHETKTVIVIFSYPIFLYLVSLELLLSLSLIG